MRTRTVALSIAVAILAVCAYWFVLGTFHLRALQGDPVSWWAFDLQKDNIEQIKFDFIIVGAGVTGSVIAARLNKIGYRVLLLEKGGPDVYGEDLFDIIIAPSQFTHTVNDPRFSWSYATTEQPSLNGRRVPIPQAKVYGGNAMIAPLLVHIPSKQYFEDWKVKGWEYENMQKIFDVVRLNQSSPITHNSTLEFLNAAKSLGYKTLDDTKGEEGFGTVPVMQQAGRRWTSADTHLKYAIRWSNRKEKMLKHTIGVQATKVLFNNNKVATGVEFVDSTGKKFVAHASKEVILCAGAINTPQLLMLSGVGPKQQLDAHGIQVVADLPGVGKNLQDQIAIPVIFESKLPSLQTERTVSNEVHWILFGEGPLASSVFEGVGLVKSQPSLQHPDIQLIIAPAYYENHKSNFDRDALTILVTVPQPHSKGTVELQSSDPLAAPKINPNFLGDKQDLQVLLKGFEVARKLAQSTKNVVGQELIPGSKVEGESGFLKYVQEQLIGLFFQVGTCRIGSDANAVVDENLLVKGIQNLRVVDASILPSQPAGNPYITLLAVAEKAVLSITQKYQQ